MTFYAVISTLLTFVTTFRKAHEENLKQAELEKKKAEKEAEAEKAKNAQLTGKNVLSFIYFAVLVYSVSSLYLQFLHTVHRTLNHQIQDGKLNKP